ncbi:7TM diverse intracellular signaling domain-containing protein [Aquimarina sp. 2304DJ70-9]|uniref:7TM diverse intracellular signaling domain-containing protein n=1 Tax=Aquimarina penaris TaxID=3231044 RepID=UPI003463339C
MTKKKLVLLTQNKCLLLLTFISIIICSSCNNLAKTYEVKDGLIDLSEIDFNTAEKINLEGDWHFYWKQLPFNEDGFSLQNIQNPKIISVPGGWIGDYFTGRNYKAQGYATYRLKLKLGKQQNPLSLKVPRVHTALEVWVNGQNVGRLGKVGTHKKEATAELRSILVDIPNAAEIDLVIPVSSYEYRAGGGLLNGVVIGNREVLRASREQQLLIESLSAAIVLVVGLFSILFYYIEESNRKVFLYFGVFVICGVLRQIAVGESVLMSLFPETPFWIIHWLRFIPFYFGMGIAGLYFYKLFPQELSEIIVKWYLRISMLFAVFILITPLYLSSYAFVPYQFIALFGIVYAVFAVVKANFKKRLQAKLVLFAMGVQAVVMINDLLLVQQLIDGIFLMNYGFLAFVVMQVVVLFRTYKSYTQQIVQLSEDLTTAGEQLQYKEDDITTLVTDNAMRLQYKKQVLEQLKGIQRLDNTNIGNSLKKLSQEIRAQIQVEEKLSFQQEHIDLLNTEFNKRLLERYPNLSKTEQEICGLIRLKMNTKEIATYRNTSDGAIRVAKNRIRKKIDMSNEEDIERLMLKI